MWDNPRQLNLAAGALVGIAVLAFGVALAQLLLRSPHLPVREIRVIMHHKEEMFFCFIKALGCGNCSARFIHESVGKEECDFGGADNTLADFGIPFFFKTKGRESCFYSEPSHAFAANIMSCACKFLSRVTESYDEWHIVCMES